MVYPLLDLRMVGLAIGVLLLAAHGTAFLRQTDVQEWLRRFPRSQPIGFVLLTIGALWAFTLIAMMDLGEFTPYRRMILVLIPVAYFLTLRYVEEFLAVRALGIVLLLAAEIPIEAAFLRPELSRLLLVILAYVWATLGMFYVGMPYLLRDQVEWLTKTAPRWKAGCIAGITYGALLVVCAVLFYR